MERHASALKAARQAVKRRDHNRAIRTTCRNAIKEFKVAAAQLKGQGKDGMGTLRKLEATLQRTLTKAASKNVYKKGTVSRQISRLVGSAARTL
jgi:ribosomal protein S20